MQDVNLNDRIKLQSEVYTGVGPQNVKLDFLVSPALGMKAPILERLMFVFSVQVDVGASGADERDLYDFITQVRLRDATGTRIDLSGASWRVQQRLEAPPGATLPVLPLAASTNNQTRTFYAFLDFKPWWARSRNDFALPLREFAQVGQLQVITNDAGNGVADRITNLDSIQFYVVAEVADDVVPEMKARLCYQDFVLARSDDWYPIDGALRWFVAHNGNVGQIAGGWPTQLISSRGLELNSIYSTDLTLLALREKGLQFSYTTTAGVVIPSGDPFLEQSVIPVLFPTRDEKSTRMPDVKSVHYKTDGVITAANNPKIIASWIGERSAAAAAATLGLRNGQQVEKAVEMAGVVVGADGKRRRVVGGGWDGRFVNRLPVKIKKG